MKVIYSSLAYVYDKLVYDVDYEKWTDYIESVFRKYKVKPSMLLDLGCGTGRFCISMAQKGYEMIGVDISTDMLACARANSIEKGCDILFLCQDMTDFELYGTVDAVLCLLDSVNYITDKRNLKRMLKRVKNYLNPGGLFIFDVNTLYKFESILGDNVFYEVEDNIAYIWQNNFDSRRRICEFDITLFSMEEEGMYRRYDEVHYEKAYARKELEEMIAGSGLELLAVCDDKSFRAPHEKSERMFFICRK